MKSNTASRWERGTVWRKADNIGSVTLFVIACFMLVFYVFATYRVLMHSDAAMKLMLGEQMAQQFALLPRDWNYVNDIWILFPSLIAAPLLWIFEPSMLLHSVVDAIAAGCVLAAAWVAADAIGIRGALRWLPPTLLACGLSGQFAEVSFGQSAYSSTLFTLLMLCAAAARAMQSSAQTSVRHTPGTRWIAILLFVSVASGPRGLASFSAPFLLACVGTALTCGTDTLGRASALRLLPVGLLTTFVGGITFLFLSHHLPYHMGALSQGFATRAQIFDHLQLVVSNWFDLFDALPPSGGRFNVVLAGIAAVRMAIAAGLFLIPLALLLRVSRLQSRPLIFLVWLHAAIVVSTLYLFVFTGVMVDEVRGAPRYLIPILPSALLICTLWLQDRSENLRFNAPRAGWLISVAMLCLSPLHLIAPAFADWHHPTAGWNTNQRAALVEILQKAGLHRGFAEYWDASVVSVLSSGNVRIAPVLIGGGLPTPMRHLSSERWYRQNWAEGPTFFVIGQKFRDLTNRSALDLLLGAPSQTLRTGEFEILVYPFNIGTRLGFDQGDLVRLPHMTAATCAAQFTVETPKLKLAPGQSGVLTIHAKNPSSIPWSQDTIPTFNPGLQILDPQKQLVAEFRGILPHPIPPGKSGEIILSFRAPENPGSYWLYSSFVAEGDAWCGNLSNLWAKAELTVER